MSRKDELIADLDFYQNVIKSGGPAQADSAARDLIRELLILSPLSLLEQNAIRHMLFDYLDRQNDEGARP